MPSRSAPTTTISAPYAGSAHASSSAWRLEPAPETRTASRAGRGISPRGGSGKPAPEYRRGRAALAVHGIGKATGMTEPPAPPPYGTPPPPSGQPPPAPGYGPPPPAPGYGPPPPGHGPPPPYGQAPYGQAPYAQPPGGYYGMPAGYGVNTSTNGYAIAALVCSLVGLFICLPA